MLAGKRVVVVARLKRGYGQELACIIGQKKGVGRAGTLAALVANGGPAVFDRGVTAVELGAGQV